jgi:hypothetical protein
MGPGAEAGTTIIIVPPMHLAETQTPPFSTSPTAHSANA